MLDFSDRTRTGISKLISRCARFSLFVGDTILEDAVDFDDNGWEASLDEDFDWSTVGSVGPVGKELSPFNPRVSSTLGKEGQVNYSSHLTNESTLDFDLDSTIQERHQAGHKGYK